MESPTSQKSSSSPTHNRKKQTEATMDTEFLKIPEKLQFPNTQPKEKNRSKRERRKKAMVVEESARPASSEEKPRDEGLREGEETKAAVVSANTQPKERNRRKRERRKKAMVVEESARPAITEEKPRDEGVREWEETKAAAVAGEEEEEEEEAEEGEIVEGGGESSAAVSRNLEVHPLEPKWTFWFDDPSARSKQYTWGSSMRPISTFSTVEEFWSVYSNIYHPSKLPVGANFHCFKHKIEPKWEDPVCTNGGKWTLTFSKGKSDTHWLHTLLAMIGEKFDRGDEICGAGVYVRPRHEKIALWTKNAANEAAQISIGKQWKEFLDYNGNIGFIFHEDAKKRNTAAKNRYEA